MRRSHTRNNNKYDLNNSGLNSLIHSGRKHKAVLNKAPSLIAPWKPIFLEKRRNSLKRTFFSYIQWLIFILSRTAYLCFKPPQRFWPHKSRISLKIPILFGKTELLSVVSDFCFHTWINGFIQYLSIGPFVLRSVSPSVGPSVRVQRQQAIAVHIFHLMFFWSQAIDVLIRLMQQRFSRAEAGVLTSCFRFVRALECLNPSLSLLFYVYILHPFL